MFDSKTTENRRKMREELQVELRQQKKEEKLNKKRSLSLSTSNTSNFVPMKDLSLSTSSISDFVAMKERLYSSDLEQVHQGVHEFRSLLSVECSPPIQPVIDSGCVPRFVELMDVSFLMSKAMTINGTAVSVVQRGSVEFGIVEDLINKIRVEAAWVITNISSGTTQQTQVVVSCGAVPLLIQMLFDSNDAVLDQSVWALGNIAGDSEGMRDVILETGALNVILDLLMRLYKSATHIKIVRNLTWLLANLNRGRNPPPKSENMKASLEALFKLVEIRDSEILIDAFWALSYIVDVSTECSDIILGSNIMSRTHSLLEALTDKLHGRALYAAEDSKICLYAISPIMRMIGNIVTGSDEQTGVLVRMGFLKFFKPIFYRLENKKQAMLRKEMCWALSNITAGTVEQAQAVVDADLIPLLVDAMSSYELFIRKEACWAISNLLYHCEVKLEWLRALMDNNLVDSLQNYLEAVPNIPEMQSQILGCFRYALMGGKQWALKFGTNPVYDRMVEIDVVGSIHDLKVCYDRIVSDKASSLITDFLDGVDN